MDTAHHVTSPRTYGLIFAILIVFTVLTVGIDLLERHGLLHLPENSHTAVSLGIATIKATLVILFFMQVWYSPWLTWIVAGGSLLWLAILITYTLTDYVTRQWIHVPGH